MWPAFPASDYYGSSAPPRRHQPATGLPADQLAAGRGGDRRDGSHVHSRTVRRGRRPAMPLQPRHGYAAGIHRGLPAGDINRPRSSPPAAPCGCALLTQPRSARFELVVSLEGRSAAGSSRTPSRLACRTRTIWQCWPVPSLSGLLPPSPLVPGIRLPSASPARCDGPAAVSFHHRTVRERLVALDVAAPGDVGGALGRSAARPGPEPAAQPQQGSGRPGGVGP